MRRLSPATFFIAAFSLIYLAALLSYLYVPYRVHGGRTRFAPGFSEIRFQSLAPGTSMQAVHAAIGKPLQTRSLRYLCVWIYAPPEWWGTQDNPLLPKPKERSMFTPTLDVYFDERGLSTESIGAYREHPRAGLTYIDVFRKLGTPSAKIERSAMTLEDYSEPDGSEVHMVRRVYYDTSQMLVDTEAFTWFGDGMRDAIPEMDKR